MTKHWNNVHARVPPPDRQHSTFRYHPALTARPCDEAGNFLPPNSPPPPRANNPDDWSPFDSRSSFELAELVFEKAEMSAEEVNQLLRIWAAHEVESGRIQSSPFSNHQDLLATIDRIASFNVRYSGEVNEHSPAWKRCTYTVLKTTLANTEPYEEYIGPQKRRWSNLMSGSWVWDQASTIAQDPATHGAMLCPVVGGADKTTVSVATGQVEYHPMYISCGNLSNTMRRAHHESVVPAAFLAIPKAAREAADDEEFRLFKKQLYHASLAKIFNPLREGMTTPQVMRCPDGHYRRVIFELGPFIADYPEQVMLAGIVQGWCPKCLASHDGLDHIGVPRFRELTDVMRRHFNNGILWEVFGLAPDVTPYTSYFPRGDIHQLLSPDILHQLVKGAFEDHLVAWVEDYLVLAHGAVQAKQIMDEIDRRIAAAPNYPGLRRFPEGRNFKQWTGNDSKALMKVFLPAIAGQVPDRMVQAIRAFLDFCYLAHRGSHTIDTLDKLDAALTRFHELRTIFEEVGVRPDGFSLPRQHSLVHYKPWRRSNRYNALGQMLRTNTRLSKLAAARVEFGRQGMLRADVLTAARVDAALDIDEVVEEPVAEQPRVTSFFHLGRRPVQTCNVRTMAAHLNQPTLQELCRRFLYDQLYPDAVLPAEHIPVDECPVFDGVVSRFQSGRVVYYAPTEDCGPSGMHREMIRSHARWRNSHARYDTVLIQNGEDDGPMHGMIVGRVLSFLRFVHNAVEYNTALVQWYMPMHEHVDEVTGMWIVKPEIRHGQRTVGLTHVETIVRGCHLIGVYGRDRVPTSGN
ncbi:hypothetical protein BDY19DRAFT_987574 [Irpex rosettiformis]|uniref:Uncharacterized protein n=1 Tax=Irpex rosettiformis TaxID=378272 RepID=A0ACB8TQE2_9APHY|nr:hypothetical protein BDY19DRAFT_987574 [Irpex rosettiformis]